ncbi:MAG: DUF3224 domain-containing protein [Candidatus Velamenicoccus archaeovorus]
MPLARGSFEVTSWDEQPYEELEGGGKLTRAAVTQRFEGDIEGEGAVQWLMAYRPDGTARYVGLQRITATIGGRSGSVVLETVGEYDGEEARSTWSVVPGSGTGGLEGLRGSGSGRAPHGSRSSFELDYAFGEPA